MIKIKGTMNRFWRGIFVPRRNKEVGRFRKLHVEKILSPAAQKILCQSNIK
jgi:hypothetical protein